MWLLDVNMPLPLQTALRDLGIPSSGAAQHGWGTLSNGRLVEAAVAKGFDCLLTRDRLFDQSAASSLKTFPTFAVVLITLPQRKADFFLEAFRDAWEHAPISPMPGVLISWPE